MKKLTFIDLFAGIGGIRMGFEESGGECVFTSEWNKYSVETYKANYPCDERHPIVGDITKVDAADVPAHDVLLAGFPCQPFSLAGVSKKNSLGRAHGFLDETQGTLFFDVARMIKHHAPKAFVLENVKNLKSHDKGRTFEVIMGVLQKELGYKVDFRIIDGKHFVPQHRERIVIVGFRDGGDFALSDIVLPKPSKVLRDIMHPQDGTEAPTPYTEGDNGTILAKYTITDNLWAYLQAYKAKHAAAGNGFGFGLVGPGDTTRTLSARYHKDGSEILVDQGAGRNPRRLTPRECARLMGYPETFAIPVSDTQSYRQFGNSVIVPVFKEVASYVAKRLESLGLGDQSEAIQPPVDAEPAGSIT
jgi:DNA (cytosine-5)-methyltransferase 1